MNTKNVPQVLLLEDKEDVAIGIMESIKALYPGPIDVWTVFNEKDALDVIREQSPDLDVVVTDILMGDGMPGGLDVAKVASARLPVIVISAFDRSDFGERSAALGPIQFVEKGRPDFGKELVRKLQSAIGWKSWNSHVNPEESERRSLCLAREPGTILAIRSHLSPLPIAAIGDLQSTVGDFHSIAVGLRFHETAIQRQGGSVYAFHDQVCMALFPDRSPDAETEQKKVEPRRSLQAAFEACRISRRLSGDTAPALNEFPFSGGLASGTIVTGVFGMRTPGHASIIGRLGDVAHQIASYGLPAEIGLVPAWLDADSRKWWNALGGERRTKVERIIGVDTEVELEFLKPKVTR